MDSSRSRSRKDNTEKVGEGGALLLHSAHTEVVDGFFSKSLGYNMFHHSFKKCSFYDHANVGE